MKFNFSFVFFILLFSFFKESVAQAPVNGYAQVTGIIGNTINIGNVNEIYDTIEDGEKIIIMQMQDDVIGDTSNTATFGDIGTVKSAGLYEYATILSHTELAGIVTSVTISGGLINSYNIGSNSSVQLISYPALGSPNFIITSDITGLPWNGSIGGVIAFEVNGTLNLNNYNIIADGIGFRGGATSIDYYTGVVFCHEFVFKDIPRYYGSKGEGIFKNTAPQWKNARAKILNGAGGGNHFNAGGGGGGGYTKGGEGGPGYGCTNAPNGVGGKGGLSLSSYFDINATRLFMGGGGGGGHQNESIGTDGTAGGGIVIIKANKIITPHPCSGSIITANGNSNTIADYSDGAGGAGAGGTITINCPDFDVDTVGCFLISANGGKGGDCGYTDIVGAGGGGGQGAIIYTNCISATILNKSFTKNGKGGSNEIGGSSFAENGGGVDDQGIFFRSKPQSFFKNTTSCDGNSTQFTDSSTVFFGIINLRTWDFGDGSPIDNTLNPVYLYANAGNYNVTLIVSTNDGCADTLTKSVQVYYKPTTEFTYNNVCLGDSMSFSNISFVDPSASIASYSWTFGDGSPITNIQNPNHYYALQGTYTVNLLTTTDDMCSDTSVASVTVFDAPKPIFTFSNTCLSDSALFTNSSLAPTLGSIANWSWNFGDGSPLNTAFWSQSHLYSVPGNYLVTLIRYSSNLACSDTLQDTIEVFPIPIANFGFINVCLNEAIYFNDSSIISSDSIMSRTWSFGDGSPLIASQNPSYTYTTPAIFPVYLIVITNNGCKDTTTKNVIIHPLPNAQFSSSNVCAGSNVQFTNLSNIITTDTILSYTWDFGDGSSLNNNQNPSYLFATDSSYSVQLIAVSNFGCSDSISKTVIFNPKPIVHFSASYTAGCEPLCISFQSFSSLPTGANTQWVWNLGDSSPAANSQSFDHCYTNDLVFAPAFFDVTLTVTSDSGCIATLSKNNYITVYPNPDASFTVTPPTTTITDPVISITDLSTGVDHWNWNFGDGSDTSSVLSSSTYTYADTGTYIVTLITSTQYNCIDTAYQTVIIEPDFLFYIPNAFTPDGDGINDSFIGKGVFIKEFKMSIFDRWGNMIFVSDDIDKPWDGKANHGSEIAQTEVYVYVVEATDLKDRKHKYKGIVTLLR